MGVPCVDGVENEKGEEAKDDENEEADVEDASPGHGCRICFEVNVRTGVVKLVFVVWRLELVKGGVVLVRHEAMGGAVKEGGGVFGVGLEGDEGVARVGDERIASRGESWGQKGGLVVCEAVENHGAVRGEATGLRRRDGSGGIERGLDE